MKALTSRRKRAQGRPKRPKPQGPSPKVPSKRVGAIDRGDVRRDTLFPIVGIGASAGGLEAFQQLLRALEVDTGMAFVLIQHLDPDHESALAQILARSTSLPVIEIAGNEPVQPNYVYVIPPGTSLRIANGVLKTQPRRRTGASYRPIDSFFESLAEDRRERAVGVILSGAASDGTLGLKAIKAGGGITFAQDDSAKHSSMPRSAVAAGGVDLVLSPAAIARELGRYVKHPGVASEAPRMNGLEMVE